MATNSIGTGQTYTTIGAWEAACPVDSAEEWRGQLLDEVFTEQVTITGVGTTPVILEAHPNTLYDGTEGSGPVVQDNAGGSFATINVNAANVTIEGFEVTQNGTASSQHGVRLYGGGSVGAVYFKRLLVHDLTGTAFEQSNTCPPLIIVNCLGYEISGGFLVGSGDIKVINCTGIRNLVDVDSATTGVQYAVAKNCYMAHWGSSSSHRDYLDLAAGSTKCAAHDETDRKSVV